MMRILFVLFLAHQGSVCWGAYTYSQAKSLRQSFLTDFDAHARPFDETNVAVGLNLVSVNRLDWSEQALTVTGWFTVTWTGKSAWNEATNNNIKVLQFYEGEIWRPDMVIENAIDDVGPIVETHLHYRGWYDGVTVWEPQVKATVHCVMDVTYFPFDRHRCPLTVSSWAYNASELTFSALDTSVNIDHYIESADWGLASTDVEAHTETRVVHTETRTYSKLTFYLTLQRHRDTYGLLIFLPLVLVSLLSMLVFLLPAETGQKPGYCVAILLAAVLLFTVYYDQFPVSRYLPIIVVYVIVVMLLVVSCITCTIVALYMYHHDTQEPLSPYMVSLGLFLAKISCSRCPDKVTDTEDSWHVSHDPEPADSLKNSVDQETSQSHEHLPNGGALTGHTLPRRKLTPIERNRVRPRSETSMKSTTISVKSARTRNSMKSARTLSEEPIEQITWKSMAKCFNKLCLIIHAILLTVVHFVFLVTLGIGGSAT